MWKSILAAVLALALGAWAGQEKAQGPEPVVRITSPTAGFATNGTTLPVTVTFQASAHGQDKATGNVKWILLALNGVEVGRIENKANVKEGVVTFTVDLAGLGDGPIQLQAWGVQGTDKKQFAVPPADAAPPLPAIVDRTPPVLAALTPADGSVVDTARPTILGGNHRRGLGRQCRRPDDDLGRRGHDRRV